MSLLFPITPPKDWLEFRGKVVFSYTEPGGGHPAVADVNFSEILDIDVINNDVILTAWLDMDADVDMLFPLREEYGLNVAVISFNKNPSFSGETFWQSRPFGPGCVKKFKQSVEQNCAIPGRMGTLPLRDPYLISATIDTKKIRGTQYIEKFTLIISKPIFLIWLSSIAL